MDNAQENPYQNCYYCYSEDKIFGYLNLILIFMPGFLFVFLLARTLKHSNTVKPQTESFLGQEKPGSAQKIIQIFI